MAIKKVEEMQHMMISMAQGMVEINKTMKNIPMHYNTNQTDREFHMPTNKDGSRNTRPSPFRNYETQQPYMNDQGTNRMREESHAMQNQGSGRSDMNRECWRTNFHTTQAHTGSYTQIRYKDEATKRKKKPNTRQKNNQDGNTYSEQFRGGAEPLQGLQCTQREECPIQTENWRQTSMLQQVPDPLFVTERVTMATNMNNLGYRLSGEPTSANNIDTTTQFKNERRYEGSTDLKMAQQQPCTEQVQEERVFEKRMQEPTCSPPQ
jgi:hypothetical protein